MIANLIGNLPLGLCLLLGAGLMVVEVFVPGFGLPGIMGIVFIVAGTLLVGMVSGSVGYAPVFMFTLGCSLTKITQVKRAYLIAPKAVLVMQDVGVSRWSERDQATPPAGSSDEDYEAEFQEDTWTIYNSCRIKNAKDILIICRALSEEHPVPSRDRESVRTPEDMAFEWEQHNLAYEQLPEGNHWRESSRNVDLDPDDQGKTFKEIYEERTGEELNLDTVIEHKDKIKEKLRELFE